MSTSTIDGPSPDDTVDRRRRLARMLTVAQYAAITLWMARWATWGFDLAHKSKPGELNVSDWDWLRAGAKALVGVGGYEGGGLHLYANVRQLQVGPPALLINGALQAIFSPRTGLGGDRAVLVLMIAIGVAVIAVIDVRARHRLGSVRGGLMTAIGASVLAPAWGFGVGGWAHLEDAIAIAAVVVVGLLVTSRRPRPLAAGVIAGIAIAGKPWAMIFLPIMIVMRARRDWARAMTVALLVGGMFWLPFFLVDRHTTNIFKFRWWVQAESALHALGYDMGMFAPSWIRPAQFTLGLLAVAYVARRSWPHAILAGMAARFLVDPAAWPYYGMGPLVAALLVDADHGRTFVPVATAITTAVFYGPIFFSTGADWLRLLWCVGVLAWTARLVVTARRERIVVAPAA